MIRTGLDRVVDEGLALPGRGRAAVLCNNATLTRDFRGTPEALLGVRGVHLDRILAPQHGFAGEKQDNMVESGHGTHPGTGIPIWSLYGETREPTPEMLRDLDAVIIDVQDVGTRVYTFLISALYLLRAADRAGVPVWVLDRPNPIDGVTLEGPVLEPAMESFVGCIPVPLRHGLTAGEYCLMGRDLLGLSLEVQVIRAEGWTRHLYFDETDLPWALPSPNLPTVDTAVVYPGGVMLEGTNLSEGRGTTRPFELFGAPWMRPRDVAAVVRRWALPGAVLRDVAFQPTFHKFAGDTVRGFQVHVTDRRQFRAVTQYAALFAAIRAVHRDEFAWRQPPYEYERERMPIDLIAGTRRLREAIDEGAEPHDLEAGWALELREFADRRRPYLLYPETTSAP